MDTAKRTAKSEERKANNEQRAVQLILVGACAGVWLAILAAGLWPLNFEPRNEAEWLGDKNGIRFLGHGMVLGPKGWTPAQQPASQAPAISIEVRATPAAEAGGNIGRILSCSDAEGEEDFFLGQWKSSLIVRGKTGAAGSLSPYRESGLAKALVKNRDSFLTVTASDKGTSIYLNGAPGRFHQGFTLGSSGGICPGTLILGNSPAGFSGWRGIISGLAIYDRVLAPEQVARNYESWMNTGLPALRRADGLAALYLFDEREGNIVGDRENAKNDLEVPRIFKPVKRSFLSLEVRRIGLNRNFLSDAIINVLGFIPFGIFQAAVFISVIRVNKKRALIATFLIGVSLSLAIELTQAYLPSRDSDVMDLICNSLGTLIGLAILQFTRWFVGREPAAHPVH